MISAQVSLCSGIGERAIVAKAIINLAVHETVPFIVDYFPSMIIHFNLRINA